MTKTLGPKGVEAFEGRMIDPENAARLGIYTARKNSDGEIVPHDGGNIIVFPFTENGAVVNEKFRAPGKKFWQTQGGRRTFWNSDILDDPALQDGRLALVITEGELDALTAIDCGFPCTVSVPDGAPPPSEAHKPDDGISDEKGKFEFLWNNRDRLKRIKRFILAVDNDAPGKNLASELVRRLSASRCLFVAYPEGCKDLNDVRQRHGAEAVTAVLNGAQHYPVKGVFTLADYPDQEPVKTFETGWETMDELMKMFAPSLTAVTGIPGHGKSTWLTNLLINLAELHGWKSAIFSPEMPVVPHMRDKMRRIAGRDTLEGLAFDKRLPAIDQWLSEHFLFIDHDDEEDEDISLEWIIERAADAVLRYGIRVLAIDPWNEIEHAKRRDETMSEYIGRAIRALKKFSRKYEVAVFVIAHPTKDVALHGKQRVPSLYDVDGSAAWFNKPDFGIVIDIPEAAVPETAIHVLKVRFEGTGQKGRVNMAFDRATSRYHLKTVKYE